MSKIYNLGILGCGDFLRWMASGIKESHKVGVKSLYDPDPKRAKKFAAELGGDAVESADAIFQDPDIDIACLFVPPWIRRAQIEPAAAAGKHILTTKPLGPTVADCEAMVKAVDMAGVQCGVIYNRAGNALIETYRQVFASGEVGRLTLLKHDWIHHYPEWNNWALDPSKNGGPFMDAMIHNLNSARYLMGRPATTCTFFSDNHAHPDLTCNDTEFLKLDFEDRGSAHLFITWAADLEVYSRKGNDRDHIDIHYMVTDQGWRLTEGTVEGGRAIIATKEGETRTFPIEGLPGTLYDRFVESIDAQTDLPQDLPGIREACEDIRILRDAEANVGRTFALELAGVASCSR